MKRYIILIIVVAAMYSCTGDIYDNIKELANSETVYPIGYKQEDIVARMGNKRVEIDLYSSRLKASEMAKLLPKAKKTVVEYGANRLVFDSVCSWVNIPDLIVPNTYRFTISTEDEYGNKSIPVEARQKPFTSADLEALFFTSSYSASTSMAIVVIGSAPDLYQITDIRYSYTDKDNVLHNEQTENSRFFLTNLPTGQTTQINVDFYILPTSAIDTLVISSLVEITTITQQAFDDYINVTRPFNGVPHIVSAAAPCIINGADYDLGGRGIAFFKQNLGGNDFPNYRPNGGDVNMAYGLSQCEGFLGFGWVTAGDWYYWTVEVQDPGEYQISYFQGGTSNTSTAFLTIDEFDFFGTIKVPNTTSYIGPVWSDTPSVKLSAGKHKLKWIYGTAGYNFYGLRITKVD
ncbi:MAG: hypothetical protein LBN71_00750 [Tannerella sp.]|jgi:hypothetical protein|nr:hypothetical protein [Tannerella sp.]